MKKLKISETYKSIPNGLEWDSIPDFAIITGKNGSGKSQLLEQMKDSQNWDNRPYINKSIKHIPALHNFTASDNLSGANILNTYKTQRQQILESFKEIMTHDIMQYLKDNSIDIIPLLEVMSQYNSGIDLIKQNHPNIFEILIKDNNKLFFCIRTLVSNQQLDYANIFKEILKKSGKTSVADITEQEFSEHLPQDFYNDFTTAGHLKQWFTIYLEDYNKKSGDANRAGDDTQTQKLREEKPPWDLMNEILEKYDFKYRIAPFDSSVEPIQIKFIAGDTTIKIEDLSSGEQQIISLVAWAHHEVISNNIKLLLLDEADAHLHPSFCKIFVEIIKEYVIKGLRLQVIMSTHSPSTIAYAPEESIFVMNMPEDSDTTNRITKQSKQEALEILSEGLMTLSKDSLMTIGEIFNIGKKQLLLCEGKTDKLHIEQCLLHDNDLKNKFDKIFVISMGGADNMKVLAPVLKQLKRDKSNTTILLDNDKKGEGVAKLMQDKFNITMIPQGTIDNTTKLYDYADSFKEWMKNEYKDIIDHIENTMVPKPSGKEQLQKCEFTYFIAKKPCSNKIINPLTKNNEVASNVFKNLWCEYLKTNKDIAQEYYLELIILLKTIKFQ